MKPLRLSLLIAVSALAAPQVARAQAPFSFRVRIAPPPLRVEVRGVAPSPRHFWMDGHWRWEGGRHVWWPGRWEMQRAGSVWVNARWVNEGGEWVFQEGHWQPMGGGNFAVAQPPVIVQMAPPQPQVEVIPMAPSPNHFWIPVTGAGQARHTSGSRVTTSCADRAPSGSPPTGSATPAAGATSRDTGGS